MRLALFPLATGLLVLGLASQVRSQVVRGVVRDVASGRPIPAATVILQLDTDSAAAEMTLTDDQGRFLMRSPRPGPLFLIARHVGNSPVVTTSANLSPSDTVDVVLSLNRIAAFLDTVQVKADKPGFFMSAASHGSDVFTAHYKSTNGIFLSAAEIKITRLPVASFLSAIPGFQMAKYEPIPGPSLLDINHDAHRWLTSKRTDNQENCVVAKLDYQGKVTALDDSFLVVSPGSFAGQTKVTDTLPYYQSVYDIVGIEVYRTAADAPAEWRQEIPKRCALIQFWSKFAW